MSLKFHRTIRLEDGKFVIPSGRYQLLDVFSYPKASEDGNIVDFNQFSLLLAKENNVDLLSRLAAVASSADRPNLDVYFSSEVIYPQLHNIGNSYEVYLSVFEVRETCNC